MSSLRWLLFALTVIGATYAASAAPEPAQAGRLRLEAPEVVSGGFFLLRWELPGAHSEPLVEVERAPGADFLVPTRIYRGRHGASTRSGLGNGLYYYRARIIAESGPGPWTAVAVRVEHHSLPRAFAFLGAGAIVFLSVLVLLWKGDRRT